MTSYQRSFWISTVAIYILLGLSYVGSSQIVITIPFEDPSSEPTACFTIFTESGVPQQLVNNAGSCSFDYSAMDGQLWLYPATLSVDLSGLGTILRVEVDITDYCGNGCSQAELLDGGSIIVSTENMVVNSPETLILENTGLVSLDELTMSSFEGLFLEIRIVVADSNPCAGSGDSDNDTVCDALDVCPGFDDTIDRDGNGVPDYCDVCEFERTLMESNLAGDILQYIAITEVTSAQSIESGADIVFDAGEAVDLLEGFEVELGAIFTGVIGGCGIVFREDQ